MKSFSSLSRVSGGELIGKTKFKDSGTKKELDELNDLIESCYELYRLQGRECDIEFRQSGEFWSNLDGTYDVNITCRILIKPDANEFA